MPPNAAPLSLDPKNHVASLVKAVHLLELFTDQQPELTLGALVEQGGFTRTTTHRLLSTLELVGWLERADDRYRLTLKVFRLGSTAVGSLRLRNEASSTMSQLAARFEEDVYLVVPDGPRAVCVERIEGPTPVRIMALDLGKSLPLFVGGGPIALLAARADLLPVVLRAGPMVTPTGLVVTPDELEERLRQTREAGYSVSREDVTFGVGALGAPIFDSRGKAVAAISIGALLPHLAPPRDEAFAEAIRAAAAAISARLGYQQGEPPSWRSRRQVEDEAEHLADLGE